jgi:hypothetical protein
MTTATTQTGMPIIDCGACGMTHPAGRQHCGACGRPSLFISPAGACLQCAPAAAATSARCGAPYCVLELEHVGGHRVTGQVL